MVSVALDELRHVLLPQAFPVHTAAGVLREPLVVELIDHEQAEAVAEVQEVLAVRVVRRAHMVVAEILHQLQPLLDGTRIGGGAERAKRVMVCPALQQHLLAVEEHALLGRELDGANAERLADAVGGIAESKTVTSAVYK